ncbi:hypothetical protein A3F08_03230 [Candidatus Berkelbacteria bacterium RIFCSPHIGHO2_12_FULL_36_9]|uniref:ABC transporter permease n=1 Tax=Candidatus Berkelbacteria bacterium RIFCSPHIGHO2_12_FULL_36_9 TaxID=1797469 RepID=A0A1F5EKF3_9BACT|nr:MAG: hypothetical protein A3F08_03230 [Candidatus Berkelbacteria bacterium RIFCSPHIGHO2_12_FULL_36_9]
MNKYWVAFKTNLETHLEYRLNLFLQTIGVLIFFIGLIILWTAIYNGKTTIGDFTLNEMITYLFLSGIIYGYGLYTSAGDEMDFWIKWGTLSPWLTKPFSVPIYWFIFDLTRRFFNLIAGLIAFFILFIFISKYLILDVSILTVFLVFFTMILGGILSYLIFYPISLLAFWIEQTWGIRFVLRTIVNLFTGAIIPLSLLPGLLQKIILVLPFKYIIYFPVQIFLGKIPTSQIVYEIMIELVWILLLLTISIIVYNNGVRRYTAVGG